MNSSVKQTFSSPGSFKEISNVGNISPKISRSFSSLHPRGFKKIQTASANKPVMIFEPSASKVTSLPKYHSFKHGVDFGHVHCNKSKENNFKNPKVQTDQKKQSLIISSEKETMMLLNDRLAMYLQKVHSLEKANAEMEKKIREWYDKHHPQTLPDFNNYFGTIEELQKQISLMVVENARTGRHIDNARLAADSFRKKSEIEFWLRNSTELDVKNLSKDLLTLDAENHGLEMQTQKLEQEILSTRKKNEDKVKYLHTHLGARVNVEVETAPAIDLSEILSEIRDQYEELMESNKTEAENWFTAKTEELKREEMYGLEHPQIFKSEIIELNRHIQSLEVDLKSQLSTKSALENTLTETKTSYSSQLAELQDLINKMEAKLAKIRSEQARQKQEYKILMDATMYLEKEISTYRLLLEKQDIHIPRPPLPGMDGCQQGVKFFTITEETERRKILAPRGNC